MLGIGGQARAEPDAPAFVSLRRTISFAELDERCRRVAGLLQAEGLEPGGRIAILAGNRPEVIEVIAGTLRAGYIPVPVNALLTAQEVAYLLEDSGATWVFTDRALELEPGLHKVITFGDAYERSLAEALPADIADFILTRPMHYTSGTTGLPKGVYVAPSSPEEAAATSERFCELWGLTNADRHIVCSPLAHSAPLRFAIRTLEAGGAVLVQETFDAEQTLAAIELFGASSTFMVPTHLERIVALGPKLARYDRSSMRLLAHAGAPIRQVTKRTVIDLFPEGSVWEFYGSTEGQATRISSDEWLARPGSVGRALSGTGILITAADGSALPSGETGEVWVDGTGAERFSYWGDAGKTKAAWRGDAFSVGDLGWLDEDGYLFLAGRQNDTIITGGINVYPQEVEAVLAGHPGVAEVMVFGTPHEEWGQEVAAMIVPAPGAQPDAASLRAWTRERLASFKTPRHIQVVTELPRTATGKPKRPTG
jgi:acyl-CoA synthetase (AMP-forming)/AMP-acid ligase II